MNMSNNTSNNTLPPPVPLPPYGYELIDGPDHQKVLVPTFMVPATRLALEKRRTKINMKVDEAGAGVWILIYSPKFI
jgi:hypothetical protein